MLLINNKAVFVHLPRTGGMFTRKVIYATENLDYQPISNCHDALYQANMDLSEYYKFGFVRNPWEWHLSYYFKLNLGARTKQGFNKWVRKSANKISLQKMYYRMYCQDKELILDEIFDSKNLEQSIHFVYDKFGWEKPQRLFDMEHVGTVIQKGKRTCQNMYNKESIDLVYQANKDIIEMYNYDFN